MRREAAGCGTYGLRRTLLLNLSLDAVAQIGNPAIGGLARAPGEGDRRLW
jgi:hypothetical protein